MKVSQLSSVAAHNAIEGPHIRHIYDILMCDRVFTCLLICDGVCAASCFFAAFGRAAKGGESLLEVQARASEALEACLDGGHDTNLIVSHGR